MIHLAKKQRERNGRVKRDAALEREKNHRRTADASREGNANYYSEGQAAQINRQESGKGKGS